MSIQRFVGFSLAGLILAAYASPARSQSAPAPTTAPAFSGVPFSLGAEILPDSALDVSFLLHRPAGKRGAVQAQGERLVFRDGSPAAFWGVNLCWDAQYPTTDEGAAVARRLAMSGCNLARLTYLDGGPHGLFRQDREDTSTFDAERLARLDHFSSELKKQGVYSLLVLGMGRSVLKPADGGPVYDDPQTAEAAYAVGRFFDARIQQADQKVWRMLLEHVNPHTGMRWADDPAIAGIEILNEASLFYRYDRFERLPEPLRARIQIHWNRWLAIQYGSRAVLAQRWGQSNLRAEEDPQRGTVALDFSFLQSVQPRKESEGAVPGGRGADWNHFVAEVCRRYYQEQIRFLRDLDVKQPISCNGGGSFSAADKWSNREGDLFDQHMYHDHPNWTPYLTYTNKSALQSGLGIIQSLAKGRLAGMPYGVSEYDFCYPSDWRAEGWVPMAAYARFQGWSALTAFAYWSGSWDNREAMYSPQGRIEGVWRFHNDPAAFGQWPLTALIFLRGDVQQARHTVDIGFSEADTFTPEPGRFPPDAVPFLDGVSLVHRTRQTFFADRFTDETTDLAISSGRTTSPGDYGSARRAIVGAASAEQLSKAAAQLPRRGDLLPPLTDGWRVSDTGELRYRATPGIFVIDTPRTQGVVGFAGGSGSLTTRDLEITCSSEFGSVVLASLDGRPLVTARRILLVAVGKCQNSGFFLQQEAATRYIANGTNLGKGPILIDPVRFALKLRGGKGIKAFALDGTGKRIAPLEVTEEKGDVRINADGSPATIYYELVR